MQIIKFLTLASVAVVASARRNKVDCVSSSVSAAAATTPSFSLGGGYNSTVTASSVYTTQAVESTVTVPVVVTVTDCPSSVSNCPARTHTTYYISTQTSAPAASTTSPAAVTETVTPVPVSPSSTTTYTSTSTSYVTATVTLPLSSSAAVSTCAVSSTVTVTISLPPVTVTVQSTYSSSTPAAISSVGGAPPSSVPYPTGTMTYVPVPSGTAPVYGSGTIPGGLPTGSPIATGAAGKVAFNTAGLFVAVAALALML